MRRGVIRLAGLMAALAVAGLLIVALWPEPAEKESDHSGIAGADAGIARGQYLVTIGNCLSCHTRPGGAEFAGGVAFETPLGTIYSTNITPDKESGIGRWSAGDLRRAMHLGIRPDGSRLFPAFPYPSFTKVSDEDIDAIYLYLRSLKPSQQQIPQNGILLRQRWAMKLWNMAFFTSARYVPSQSQGEQWNRGAYLVQGLAHCGACHSPRTMFLAEATDKPLSGGALQSLVAKGLVRRWSAVDLRPSKTGLGAWSAVDLHKYLKTGLSARAGSFGPMNEVIVNSTRHWSDSDLDAVTVFLKGLPVEEKSPPTSSTSANLGDGAALYKARCEKCHSSSGRGGLFTGPPLTASAVVQAADPASLINVILYGPDIPKDVPSNSWETMQGYADILSDQELAAVASYIRGSWGNTAAPISGGEVAAQR